MKKILRITLLLVALFLNQIPILAYDERGYFNVDGLWYHVIDTESQMVALESHPYELELYYVGDIVIPGYVTDADENKTYIVSTIDGAFGGCSKLTSVCIPNTVTSISLKPFWGCSGLTSIVVDDENVVYDSRNNCNAIIETATNTLIAGCKNTNIPNTVTSIGMCAFQDCLIDSTCTTITIPNSVNLIDTSAFEGSISLTSVSIPNSVTTIRMRAFYFCFGLNGTLVIPNSVKYIGKQAFTNCLKLDSLSVSESVTTIDGNPFMCCIELESIVVDENNETYDSRDNCNAIIETASNTLIAGCKSTVIPNTVTKIGDSAFYGMFNALDSVYMNIPNSVVEIGEYAFEACLGLRSVVIPSSVTKIGLDAFSYCENITTVTSLNREPPVCSDNAFEGISPDCVLYVPAGCKERYKSANVWKNFTNIVELPSGIEDIEEGCNGVVEVARYDIHGRLLTEPTSGINIVKYSDGSTRKELVK